MSLGGNIGNVAGAAATICVADRCLNKGFKKKRSRRKRRRY